MIMTLPNETIVIGFANKAIIAYEQLKQIHEKVEIIEMPNNPNQMGCFIFKY